LATLLGLAGAGERGKKLARSPAPTGGDDVLIQGSPSEAGLPSDEVRRQRATRPAAQDQRPQREKGGHGF